MSGPIGYEDLRAETVLQVTKLMAPPAYPSARWRAAWATALER